MPRVGAAADCLALGNVPVGAPQPCLDQSSRSLRLGVRLGSLARKPNTKIPMKKNTTE